MLALPDPIRHIRGRLERRRDYRTDESIVDELCAAWRAACIGAGLSQSIDAIAGCSAQAPPVVDVTLGPPTVLIVELLPGQLAEDARLLAPRLAGPLGAVALRIEPHGVRHMRVELLTADPLGQVLPLTLPRAATDVLLGVDEAGQEITLDWRGGAHTAIQGVTRSGKSVLSYALLAQLAAERECLVAGLDPTGLLLRPFADTRHAKHQALGLADIDAHEAVLVELVATMDRRIAELPLDRDTLELSADAPAVVVVLEEYPGLLRAVDALDKDSGKRVRALVSRLLAEGAKVGYRVIMLAQRAEAAVIGSFERAMCSTRISFRTDSRGAVELLHPGTPADVAEAHTAALPGIGLITRPGVGLERFRAPYLGGYPEYVAAVLEAVAS